MALGVRTAKLATNRLSCTLTSHSYAGVIEEQTLPHLSNGTRHLISAHQSALERRGVMDLTIILLLIVLLACCVAPMCSCNADGRVRTLPASKEAANDESRFQIT